MSSTNRERAAPRRPEAAGAESHALTDSASGVRLGADDARNVFRLMVRTMALAERLAILGHRREFRGGLCGGTGTETLRVVSACCLQPQDVICPGLYHMGAVLARGLAPETILRGHLARLPLSTTDGERSLPGTQLDNHVVATVSRLKQVVSFVAGAVWAEKRGGRDAVGMTYVAEDRSNPDEFDEAVGFAARWKIPLVLVVENGQQDAPTSAETSLADRAKAHGVSCVTADGTSVLAVYGAVRRAVDRARRGEGPGLIECAACRRDEGRERRDPSHVPRDLMSHVQNKELTARFERTLVEAGIIAPDEAATIRTDEHRRVLDALHAVERRPGANSQDSAE